MVKFNHFRYVIVSWVAIGLFIMVNIEKHPLTILESTTNNITKDENSFKLESLAQGIQAFQYTTYISMLLFANLILKWDSKIMLAIGLGGMSLCHLLIPTILLLDKAFVIIVYIFQGLFHGMIFPFFLTITSFWAPIMENTTLISISLSGYYVGLGLCKNIFFKLTPTNLNVPFYVFGGLGLCWTVVWLILAKAKPSDDPKITQTERNHILSNGNKGGIITLTSCIRKRVFYTGSTLSICLVILCVIFNFAIVALMVTFLGLNKMLDDTILYSYLVAAFVIVAVAFASDHLRQKYCITIMKQIIICIGLFLSAIMISFIGMSYPANSTSYSALLGSCIVVQAIIETSCFVNVVDVMHHAAGYALGVFLGLTPLIMFLVVVSLRNNSDAICWVAIGLNVVGCVTYAICGSTAREIWVINQAEPRTETSIALNETSNDPVTPSNVEIVSN